jgi:SAM-dependent methyltransferase
VEGYDASTYGERFADVYDDWYADLGDVDACVKALVELAGGGPVLELGVGTGRLAIPLAEAGIEVTGIDASPAMLQRLGDKPGGERVETILGDMADPALGERRFAAAFVAYNTFFNLVDVEDQRRCLRAVADHLEPGGRVAIEAFVPDHDALGSGSRVEARTVTADKVVLSVSRSDPDAQELSGQYVDITEAGIRLRPWRLRWATPDQLDALAADAGLALVERWAGWDRSPFGPDDDAHVSVYARRTQPA